MAARSVASGIRRFCFATAGIRGSSPFKKREHLWRCLVQNPWAWWDFRQDKRAHNNPSVMFNSQSCKFAFPVDCARASLHPHGSSLSRGHEIQHLCLEGNLDKAFDTLSIMDFQGIVPSQPVYYSLLKACNKKKSLVHARRLQAHLLEHRLDEIGFIGDYLVVTLVKCGAFEDSLKAFQKLHHQTVFSWTAIISAYSSCGKATEALKMYKEMCEKGVGPDEVTISSVLKACNTIPDLDEGRLVHADAVKYGFNLDLHIANTLLTFYGKRGRIFDAEFVFSGLIVCNAVSWNAMLSAYVECGEGERALMLFRQMQAEHVQADQRTFVIALQACCILIKDEILSRSIVVEFGQALHSDLSKQGLASDVYINNTLISLYGKCKRIQEVHNLFCEMLECNTESWNEVIAAHVEQGCCAEALQLYRQMLLEGVCLDQWTVVLALQACWTLASKETSSSSGELKAKLLPWLDIGEALHADAEVKDLASGLFVGNGLVNMYGKCRKVKEAEKVFSLLSKRDIVSWNSMLSAYIDQVGFEDKALELYMQMEASGQSPDDITFGSLLRASSGRGSADFCKVIHFIGLSLGVDGSSLFLNTLIHAYGCCASMKDAEGIFYKLPKRSIVSWNAVIAGHALNGDGMRSLESFQKMQEACIMPDGITFISLFFACSHAGFVDKAVEFLDFMGNYGIALDRRHVGSLLDLLGRAGDFKSLESVLWKMPLHPDATLWSSLLGACQMHNNLHLAREAFISASFEQPEQTNTYVLMGNLYAKDGLQNG